jgi:hypothetical protein
MRINEIDKMVDILIKSIKRPIIITNYPDDSFFTSLKEVADNNSLEYIELKNYDNIIHANRNYIYT